jgi:hypothetical protein
MSQVGTEGTIVIDRDLREQLGVQPGAEAVQWAQDGLLVVRFLPPPEEKRSMFACLPLTLEEAPWLATETTLNEAIEEAVTAGSAKKNAG